MKGQCFELGAIIISFLRCINWDTAKVHYISNIIELASVSGKHAHAHLSRNWVLSLTCPSVSYFRLCKWVTEGERKKKKKGKAEEKPKKSGEGF